MSPRLLALCLSAPIALGAPAAFAGETVLYTYDELGRLIRVTHAGTVNNGVTTDIDYDAAGNRTDYDVTGSNGSGSGGGVTGIEGSGAGGAPSFSVGDATATEGGVIAFVVTKAGSAGTSYTVNYTTSDGSALVGSDYVSASGQLTFLASESSKTVSISTVNDALGEQTETMYLDLSAASGGATISDAQGAGTISDDDAGNQAPVVVNESYGVSCLGGTYSVMHNDTDPDGDTISFTVNPGAPLAAYKSGTNTITVSGTSQSGTYVIGYTVTDIHGASTAGGMTLVWSYNSQQCGGGGGPEQ